jgi:hypothetical protein
MPFEPFAIATFELFELFFPPSPFVVMHREQVIGWFDLLTSS